MAMNIPEPELRALLDIDRAVAPVAMGVSVSTVHTANGDNWPVVAFDLDFCGHVWRQAIWLMPDVYDALLAALPLVDRASLVDRLDHPEE